MFWLTWQLLGVVLALGAVLAVLVSGAWIVVKARESPGFIVRLSVGILGAIVAFWLLFWRK